MSRRRRAWRPAPTTDTRPPEARLEAMVREPNRDRVHRIMARIDDDLRVNPDPSPWLAAARTLWERLIISEDSWYYLAEMLTECLVAVGSERDPELVRLYEAMTALEREHGLGEDEHWHVHDAPPDYETLSTAWDQRANHIVNSYLRQSGHADVADAREKNLDDFYARTTKGRIDLWGRDEGWDRDDELE